MLLVLTPLIITSLFSEALWVGYATIPLTFSVTDSTTNLPVIGASVRLEGDPEFLAPLTKTDGMTTLTLKAMCAGRSSFFRRTRSVNYGFWMVKVNAKGYLPMNDELKNYTHRRQFHDKNATPPPIEIQLKPAP